MVWNCLTDGERDKQSKVQIPIEWRVQPHMGYDVMWLVS